MAIPISSLYRYLPPTHILLSAKSQIVTQRQVPSSSHVTAGNCEITIADCNLPFLLQQLCMGARILLSANVIYTLFSMEERDTGSTFHNYVEYVRKMVVNKSGWKDI